VNFNASNLLISILEHGNMYLVQDLTSPTLPWLCNVLAFENVGRLATHGFGILQ